MDNSLLIGLGVAGAGALTAFALLFRSSTTLFQNAGKVDAEEPKYVTDARQAVESLDLQYSVAAELHQDPATVDELGRRLDAARTALDNALSTARHEATQPAHGRKPVSPVTAPVPVRRRSAVDDQP
ncbi:MAG: hypothetical protein K2W95_25195 [Candidatus Obscuribacterales bacterium]|nr:hypothetical protein [Candidatus Obscuribacterales bacterium]